MISGAFSRIRRRIDVVGESTVGGFPRRLGRIVHRRVVRRQESVDADRSRRRQSVQSDITLMMMMMMSVVEDVRVWLDRIGHFSVANELRMEEIEVTSFNGHGRE